MKKIRLRLLAACCLITALLAGCTAARRPLPEQGKPEILRDIYGVPHIYADTYADAACALGYMHALDRPEFLFRAVRSARAEGHVYFGKIVLLSDWAVAAYDLRSAAEKAWPLLSPKVREIVAAYADGINLRLAELDEKRPAYMCEVTPLDIIVWNHSRIVYSLARRLRGGRPWSQVADAAAETVHASNTWVIGPGKTRDGCIYGLMDPHWWWTGNRALYEAHLEGPEFHVYGHMHPGCPFPFLGHNKHIFWSGTASQYLHGDMCALQLDPARPEQYFYDGKWHDFEFAKMRTHLPGDRGKTRELTIRKSIWGPVFHIDEKARRAYVARLAIADRPLQMEQALAMCLARNREDFERAIGIFASVSINLVYGDDNGNYGWYLYGRLPKRSIPGHEKRGAIRTWREKMEWRGFKSIKELRQIHNPPCGYIQQCNSEPEMTVWLKDWDSLRNFPHDEKGGRVAAIGDRGASAHRLLHRAADMTDEDAKSVAADFRSIRAPEALREIFEAIRSHGRDYPNKAKLLARCESILRNWDMRLNRENTGATLFSAWNFFMGIKAESGKKKLEGGRPAIVALVKAAEFLQKEFGDIEVPLGRLQILVWGNREYPCSGGESCLRSVSFQFDRKRKRLVAVGGQGTTSVVRLKRGELARSWTLRPCSITEDKNSPYYYSWVEKYSRDEFRPTFFNREDLTNNTAEKFRLERKMGD